MSAPLVPWFVKAWYECTTCTVVCGGLVPAHHLYRGLWEPGTFRQFCLNRTMGLSNDRSIKNSQYRCAREHKSPFSAV